MAERGVVRLSARGQVIIGKEFRRALRLHPGDQLLVEVEDGRLVLRPRPRSYAEELRGRHREVWEGLDAAAYVDQERRGWEA